MRIMQGFFAGLPPPGVEFFDRTFERPFPKPLQPIINKSWQKTYGIWKHDLPNQQALVIRDLEWIPYRNSTIGVNEPIPVASGVLSDSLGFQFLIGSRWEVNIKNNLQGVGSPNVAASSGNSGFSLQESSVPSGMDPTGGSFSRRYGAQGGFVLYARGGQRLESKFFAIKPPPVELLKIQFRISGWSVPSTLLDNLFEAGEWGLDNTKR
ncbi:MAG TPA: hypothetical protein VIY27_10420 [Myxococcota bacterium]